MYERSVDVLWEVLCILWRKCGYFVYCKSVIWYFDGISTCMSKKIWYFYSEYEGKDVCIKSVAKIWR